MIAKVGPASERVDNVQRASSGRSITIAVPLDAIGPLTVTAPAPVLVSPDVGAEHVGCTREVLVEHLSWMARHPQWRDRVIVGSRKRRFASPDDVVASMRERYAAMTGAPAAVAPAAGDELAAEQAALEADLGIVDAPPVGEDDRKRRGPRRGAVAASASMPTASSPTGDTSKPAAVGHVAGHSRKERRRRAPRAAP